MGLDISYYSNVVKSKHQEESDDYDLYDINDLFTYNPYFKYQLGSLENNTWYSKTVSSVSDGFCAGSYSSYNYWRNDLAIMSGYGSAENVFNSWLKNERYIKLLKLNGSEIKMKPFYELINFSDAEGTIGPEVSAKLYQDFVDFDESAKKYSDKYFYKKYCEWKEAFRVASDNGAVNFH